jgi:hypothetical protein
MALIVRPGIKRAMAFNSRGTHSRDMQISRTHTNTLAAITLTLWEMRLTHFFALILFCGKVHTLWSKKRTFGGDGERGGGGSLVSLFRHRRRARMSVCRLGSTSAVRAAFSAGGVRWFFVKYAFLCAHHLMFNLGHNRKISSFAICYFLRHERRVGVLESRNLHAKLKGIVHLNAT